MLIIPSAKPVSGDHHKRLYEINKAVTAEREDFRSEKIGYVTRARDLYKELKSRLLDEKKAVDEILADL